MSPRPATWRNERARLLAGGLAAMLITMPEPGRTAEVVENVGPGRPTIDVSVGEGRLLHFDGPVDSVFIADPAIADVHVVSPDTVYVFAKKGGGTNLIATSKDQRVRGSVQFRIVTNSQPVNDAMRWLQPGTTTELSILGERVAITGKTRTIEEAVDAQNTGDIYSPNQPPINNTTIAGSQQVNIRVRFAEVSRTELQSLGFNWKVFGGGSFSTVGLLDGKINIEVLIDAMRRSGLMDILAEPNLTSVSGQTANFLAGGEVPVPIAQPGGTMQVIYKTFGVSLDFTPTIIATNRIALHVRPEVSAIAQTGEVKINGISMPSFTVRRADTTVEVASGETFAIAGLFQRQMSQETDKLPGLGEVPVLKALFSSERFRRNETELVILITPYLVQPMQNRMSTPLDRPAPPASRQAGKPSDPPRSSGLIMK
jgi:pilus assembly protein CpaC